MSALLSVQILFTEDDPEELRLLREILEARGYEVGMARLGQWPGAAQEVSDSVVALLGGSASRGEELEALGEISSLLGDRIPMVAIASPEQAGWVEEALHWGATDQLLRDPGGVHIRMLPAVLGRALERARFAVELERREAERLESQRRDMHSQRLESLGILAGGVAHDFNNLLVAILGHADLAMSSIGDDSPIRQDLEPIIASAEQAAELCRQMLAFSGQGQMSLEEVDLGMVIAQMKGLLRSSLPGKTRLKIDAPTDLATIQGDPSQIRQVVMNLLLNAAEAIGDVPGTVTISVQARACDKELLLQTSMEEVPEAGRFVILSVEDTGCGMEEETRNRLFEPFFTTKFTGRGLGTSAILGIARAHGGAVIVESELGQGSTLRVLFPIQDEAGPEVEVATEPMADSEAISASSGVVLVVDDEDSVRELARTVLEQGGYSVLTAADGAAGLALFEADRGEIVCVLLDLTMPDMSGDEVFERMHRRRPEVPVVLTSGFHIDEVMARLEGPQPAGFIQKPYRVDSLLDAIREVVG